jgi:(S)-ureidoglycine aminohydrolase
MNPCRSSIRNHCGPWSILLLSTALSGTGLLAQGPIKSDVYPWKDVPVEKTTTGFKRTIIKGTGTDFQSMEVDVITLEKDKTEAETPSADTEEMVIVKNGKLEIVLNGKAQTVGRGSVAIIMPGDSRSFKNVADGQTTYYVLRYKSKEPMEMERAEKSGGSFVMDWNDVKVVPRDDGKGETRSFFTKSTAMGKRLEVHATVLKPSQTSHAPHHHRAEELVVMLHGKVHMYLGPGEKDGRTRQATDGDVVYLVSNEYHGLSNDGNEPASYIAFQFE